MATTAKLGGVPLLASSSLGWTLQSGVAPATRRFDVTPAGRDELLDKGSGPVSLVIKIDGGRSNTEIRVDNLWILEAPPADSPFLARVLVADRRWFWARKHLVRRYNVRRQLGVSRIASASPTEELQPVTQNLWFAPWSLKEVSANEGDIHRTWTPEECLEDIIEAASEIERTEHGSSPKSVFANRFLEKGLRIENLTVDAIGSTAVSQVMGYFPEADLYIDYSGNVVFYSKVTGAEGGMFAATGPTKVGTGHVQLVEHGLQRPKYIDVLFTRELELRFDYLSDDKGANSAESALGEEGRWMENVLMVPDFFVNLDGKGNKDEPGPGGAKKAPNETSVCQGDWITIPQALNAWGKPPLLKEQPEGPLDYDLILRALIPHQDIWSSLGIAGVADPGADWPARAASLQQHWRRTFRINPAWWGRTLSVTGNRVATVNSETGTRASSAAFTDYMYAGSVRSYFKKFAKDGKEGALFDEVIGYPGLGDWDVKSRPAPADVLIADHEQGIIHFNWKLDPWRVYETVIPGILNEPKPGENLLGDFPVGWDMIQVDGHGEGQKEIQLNGTWGLATIFSAIPAAPNTESQLHRVRVKPVDIEALLPGGGRSGLMDASGPPMEIRVGANYEKARVAWREDRAEDIEKAFGFHNAKNDPVNLDGLIVNAGPGGGVNSEMASIDNIARAVAARVYSQWTDRVVGSKSGDMTKITPGGWIDSVVHTLSPNGDASTSMSSPERIPLLDLDRYMDPGTRAILHNMVKIREGP